MNQALIQNIIDHHIPCYFLSPHLDDAVFSAGGLMSELAGKVDLTVINLFTNAGDGVNTLSASAYLKQCGVADPKQLFKQRVLEDKIALDIYDAKIVDLGATDSLWRKIEGRNFSLAELNAVYPTYRFHIIKGNISRHDQSLIKTLKIKIKNILPKSVDYYVFAPVGFGNHVDHLLTRKIAKDVVPHSKLIYYSDFPYCLTHALPRDFIEREGLAPISISHDGKTKIKVCAKYTSQYNIVIPNQVSLYGQELYFIYGQTDLSLSGKYLNRLRAVAKLPLQIGTYSLDHLELFNSLQSGYLYATYLDKKTKVQAFAKCWIKNRDHASYKILQYEIKMYNILSSTTIPNLKIPKLLGVNQSDKHLIMLTEKIVGTSLSSLSLVKQLSIIGQVVIDLGNICKKLTTHQKSQIHHMRALEWSIYLLWKAIVASYKNPSSIRLIWRGVLKYYFNLSTIIHHNQQTLVHRDLSLKNVYLHGKNVVLIDFQLLKFADPLIELAAIIHQNWTENFYLSIRNSKIWSSLVKDDTAKQALISYTVLFTIYHLSLPDWNQESSSIDCLTYMLRTIS